MGQTSFSDILKNKFLNQFSQGGLNLAEAILAVLFAVAIGIVISIVYKRTFKGVVYSVNFNMSLILMTVITAVIIVTIQSNLVLSLGMVGALSIVRFRSAIKDPVDIMYLFWAISMGIIAGAQQYVFALAACLIISVLCFVMYSMKEKKKVYLLIVRYHPAVSGEVLRIVKKEGAVIRNKMATVERVEITAELNQKKINETLVESLVSIRGVMSAVLVNYNGEYCD